MQIVVCIKQVPDPTQAKMNRETGTVVREGVALIMNPFDLYAVEEGLRLKEAHGGKVIALTMGPPAAEEVLREAISMGADEGILLSDRAFAGSDTWATSYALGHAIKKIGDVDLVLCGRQAIDGDTAQVGPETAEVLGWPHVTDVARIEQVTPEKMIVDRLAEVGYGRIEVQLPALLTVVKDINEPRLASLRGKMKAKKAEIPVWKPADIGVDPARVGLEGSPTRVHRTFEPKRVTRSEMLEGDARTQAKALVEKLKELQVL